MTGSSLKEFYETQGEYPEAYLHDLNILFSLQSGTLFATVFLLTRRGFNEAPTRGWSYPCAC